MVRMCMYDRVVGKTCIFLDTEGYGLDGSDNLKQVSIIVCKVNKGSIRIQEVFNTYKVRKDKGKIYKLMQDNKEAVFIGNNIYKDIMEVDKLCNIEIRKTACIIDFTDEKRKGEFGEFLCCLKHTGLRHVDKWLGCERKVVRKCVKALFGTKKNEEMRLHNAMYDTTLMLYIMDKYIRYLMEEQTYVVNECRVNS